MSTYPELRKLTRRFMSEEPPEVYKLRTGTLPDSPGSYNQYFTTWDFANGIVSAYSMNLYQLVKTATDERLSVERVHTVLRTWDPIYSSFLGYSGFPTLADYANQVREPVEDRQTLVDRLSAFTEYVNRLTAWSHHYFPWHVGERYSDGTSGSFTARHEDTPAPVINEGEPHRRVPIRLTWQPLGIEADTELACHLNEQLCADFLDALPFTVLRDTRSSAASPCTPGHRW